MLLFQLPLTSPQTEKKMHLYIAHFVTILVLVGTFFLLEVMYISRIVNSRSNSPISMVFSCLCCSHSTVRLVIVTEESWKLPNLLILIKQKSIFSQKLGSSVFCIVTLMTNSVFNKGKSTISPLFNGPDVLPSDKAKLFAKRFFKDSNFNDSGYLLSLLELI